ncbi:MAG TPA: hypothetical protein VGH81_03675 [Rudaea sp.]|jgi:hypothetical protein
MLASTLSVAGRQIPRRAQKALLALIIAGAFLPSSMLDAATPRQELVRLVAADQPGTMAAAQRSAPTIGSAFWSTGPCNTLLPDSTGAFAPPGDVDTLWLSLQQQAVAQVEAMYGQNGASDPTNVYALVRARGITRALMFATLVKAINDVHAGTATADESAWVSAFQGVVKYGREWMSIDAINRWNAYQNSTAFQSSVANNLVQLAFGLIGLPWRNDPYVPSAKDLYNDAETTFWGPLATTNDGPAGDIQNYPLGTAESAYALEQMNQALAFLNAIGQTQIVTPGGSDAALSTVMANIENALGGMSGGELAEGLIKTAELGNILVSGEGGMSHAGVFIAMVNAVWTASDAVANNIELNDNQTKAFNDTPDLVAALNDSTQLAELMNDFVAMTLHPLPNAGASGNDPDCRTLNNKPYLGPPPAADATLTVKHFNSGAPFAADYSYATQVLGGNSAGTIGPNPPPANTIDDPSILDWSFSRDVGPAVPRLGANWPISEISYGVPGDPPNGDYDLAAASLWYPENGNFYITFNGSDGQQRTTNFLYVYHDASGIHPTDSQVAHAIVDADPDDFFCNPAQGSNNDPALNPADKANWPCLDWNPNTHFGTMLIVRGDQPDGNGATPADYQVIFDITVKGDVSDWTPVFVGHGGQGPGQPSACTLSGTSSVGGICVGFLGGIPMIGDVVQSKVLWPRQKNDVCLNDPLTCGQVPSYGWATPYPVARECQSVSPAAGMFVLEYAGTINSGNPAGSCANSPNGDSWTLTPSIRYRSADGNLWTAWRVPPTVGTANFLNIQSGKRAGGPAGIVQFPLGSDHNAFQLEGSGTHWLTDFHAGDNILLVDPSSGQHNNLGGLLSAIRSVETVLDDTHINLSSSLECVSGTDGNDCVFFSTVGYTSFMNPLDGSDGEAANMFVNCTAEDCVISPQTYPFDVYQLTSLNPGTTCSTWDPATNKNPPASGCYYSNSIQFQAQTYANDGQNLWWNVSLPPNGPLPVSAPIAGRSSPSSVEPWLNQPVITQQPQSVLVPAGAGVSFTATASGTPAPSVQWQLSTDTGATWNNIPSATSTTYNLNSVTQGLSGRAYRAVFTNTAGSRTTHSATLGITIAPAIQTSPTSVQAVQPGDTVTLTGTASGAPAPSARWQISQDNGATWGDLGGATSTIGFIWPPPPTPTLQVRVKYENASGSATSDVAVVIGDRIFNSGFD